MILFCNHCGAPVSFEVPHGDNLERHVCIDCGHIQYENPKIVAGCVADWDGKLLLCRRAIEPRHGFWTLPAGFMENGETTAQAAARETLEEAGASVVIDAPFAVFNLAQINQVHFFYRGRLVSGEYASGVESLETALFEPSDIPWELLAFRSVALCLEYYLDDRRKGTFGFHEADLGHLVPITSQNGTRLAPQF